MCPYCYRNNLVSGIHSVWLGSRELYVCDYCEKSWYPEYHIELLLKSKKSFLSRITDWLKSGKR